MNHFKKDLAVAQIIALMSSYSFDTNQNNVEEIVLQWQEQYSLHWIYLATIEALYLGRYKAVSIEQIMYAWSRMGQPKTHFGGDFERVISRRLPRHFDLTDSETATELLTAEKTTDPATFSGSNQNIAKTEATNDTVVEPGYSETSSEMKISPTNTSLDQDQENKTELGDRALPIFTQVSPVPEFQVTISSHLTDKLAPSKEKELSKTGIRIFQPLPDASGFFQKLKALADSQRKREGMRDEE